MVDYIPGVIHETFQNKHYYEVKNDFIAIVCNDIRFSELFNDYDTQTSDLELIKGYVLSVRYFKYKVDATVYAYIEGYYDNNDNYIEINQETILSFDFFKINDTSEGGILFTDITQIYERDKKIEKILN